MNKFFKAYILVIILTIITLIVLSYLGNINRIGYLSEFNLIEKIEENNEYIYNFRLKYYGKIFKNSDVYGVAVKLESLPNYIEDIKFDETGSPFGKLISSKKLQYDDKLDNIKYYLNIKSHIYIYLVLITILLYLSYLLILLIKNINKVLNALKIKNIKLFLFDDNYFKYRKLFIKIYSIILLCLIIVVSIFYIFGSFYYTGKLTDFELITESKAGYVYKAKITPDSFIFKPNFIYKYSDKPLKLKDKPKYIKNYGYAVYIDKIPNGYYTDISSNFNLENGGFITSNTLEHQANRYDLIIPLSIGEEYKVEIEIRRLKGEGGEIKWYLDDANDYKIIPNTAYISTNFSVFTDTRKIYNITTKNWPHMHFSFPTGETEIKYINIEQISDKLIIKDDNSVIFTSNKKLNAFESIENVEYIISISITKIFMVLILFISLILLVTFFIIVIFYFILCSFDYKENEKKLIINEYNIKDVNFSLYEILLFIPSLLAFVSILYVIVTQIIGKINYISYMPYTVYPAFFILLFIMVYLFFYNKINDKIRYFIRLNLIYMFLYFFAYTVKNDIIKYIVILHVILIFLTPTIYRIKFNISYNLLKTNKYYFLIRNQFIIFIFFIIFYFCFNVGRYLSVTYFIISSFIFILRDLYKTNERKIYKKIAIIFTSLTIIFLIGENGEIYSDFFSDANVHVAGINYREDGFLKYYLLPDYSLPFEETALIYTHYPSLSELLFGIWYRILPEPKTKIEYEWYSSRGKNLDNWIEYVSPMLWKYRLQPLIWHIIGSFFLWAFFRKISNDKFIAMLSVLLIVTQPALLYFKFAIHYLSYASSVLMATPYIVWQLICTNKKRYVFILLLFGFLQGALSFDFILPGVGISLLFLFFPLNENIRFNKKMFYPTIILVIGVCVAFILHFIQNSFYFGSIKLAFDDLFVSLIHRTSSVSSLKVLGWLNIENLYFFNLLRDYSGYINTNRYFGFPMIFISVLFAFLCAILGYLHISISINRIKIKSDYFKRSFFFLMGAIAGSASWVLIMKQHSAIHTNFLPRHFIMLFFALITFFITFSNFFNVKDTMIDNQIKKDIEKYNNDMKNCE